MRGASCWSMSKNSVQCFKKLPPLSSFPCFTMFVNNFLVFPFRLFDFVPILVPSAFIPSVFHFTHNFGEHLSVSLASFKLSLNIIFSPQFNQLQCVFVTPQHHYFLDQGCSIALALAKQQAAAQWPISLLMLHAARDWFWFRRWVRNIKLCRTVPAHQIQSYYAGPVQHGMHLFTVDAVCAQYALEP